MWRSYFCPYSNYSNESLSIKKSFFIRLTWSALKNVMRAIFWCHLCFTSSCLINVSFTSVKFVSETVSDSDTRQPPWVPRHKIEKVVKASTIVTVACLWHYYLKNITNSLMNEIYCQVPNHNYSVQGSIQKVFFYSVYWRIYCFEILSKEFSNKTVSVLSNHSKGLLIKPCIAYKKRGGHTNFDLLFKLACFAQNGNS
jgi:hypothetical protein